MIKEYNIEEFLEKYGTEPKLWLSTLKDSPDILDTKVIEVIVSFEKDKDVNPYYSSNTRLKSCCDACMEIVGYTWETGSIKHSNIDAAYILNNNVFTIDRVAGGHRRTIDKDTQIEFTVFLRPHTSVTKFKEVTSQICERHGVSYSFKEDGK